MKNRNNHGSATVEITLLMPMVLLVTVLGLTLLISVLQQAQYHSELMVYSAEYKLGNQEWNTVEVMKDGVMCKEKMNQKIYMKSSSVVFAQPYDITVPLVQIIWDSDAVKQIRRWQLLGTTISE